MKSKLILSMFLAGLLVASSFITGCATPQNPYTYTGAGLGAAVGAAIGAGANGANPWKGAAIGALVGGATGGVAGEIYGRSNPYCPPKCPPQQRPGYYQSAPTQPGYGYMPPAGQSYSGQPAYDQLYYEKKPPPAKSPKDYSEEGTPSQPRSGSSQGTVAHGPTYRYAY